MSLKSLRIKESNYQYWRQPLRKLSNFSDLFFIKEFEDGIYTIPSGKSNIDILIRGFYKNKTSLEPKTNCIVCFSGALTEQTALMQPPYFFGVGISDGSNLPLISISDPTLALSDNLRLAWYAGNESERSLQVLISIIIDCICSAHKFQPIFVGGSGGGFAALVQSFLSKRESIALVWNPQTAIGKYELNPVLDFLDTAFPKAMNKFRTRLDIDKETLNKHLNETGIIHNICNKNLAHKIIYLQNKNDWHVLEHLNPFFRDKKISRLGKNSFLCEEKIGLHFGDWGPCHEGPPTNIIVDLLNSSTQLNSIRQIINSLTDGEYYKLSNAELQEYWLPKFEIQPNIDSLSIKIYNDNEPSSLGELEYALYWFSQGKKNILWYQKDTQFNILCEVSKLDAIQIFMKDSFGETRSFYWENDRVK